MLTQLKPVMFGGRIGKALLGISFLAMAGGVYAAHSHWLNKRGISSPPILESKTLPDSSSQRPQLEALPIMLKAGGFVPREITRPAGNYFISVTNMSGESDLELHLSREHGNEVHQAKVPKERPSWRQHVHLTPGTYLLTEATHEQWVCRINITTP